MRKSDFALISALYDSKNGGLYSDVYFPIIKYTIISLFYQKEPQEYYTHDNVKDFIIRNFGVEIPSLVIKKSIVAVNDKSSDLDLQIYENGSEFKILKAWDCSINEEIDAKARFFDTNIDLLENEYQKYVESEDIENDKTFVDFISDNTDDILGYFENDSVEKIGCEYAVMASFLKYLHDNTPDLFKIANELFWGSIIAGFLKREKISVIEKNNRIEYYLDTPIVMGLLNLSTEEKEIYAKELLDIIKSSGGLPKIHPITIEEVTSIILSVENSEHPIPNTPIEAAWYRDGLTKSKLAHKRVNALKHLEEMGVEQFPSLSPNDISKTKKSYSNNITVKSLAQSRGGISNDRGIFRDIHDVYMDDYVGERRDKKGTEDCCFFVTTNTDLVNFCRNRKQSRMRTIGASKIILELWMHNTNQSGIENKALTEMMARCFDINKRDVRNKLSIVSRYYNSTRREDFDPKVYQEIISCLYKRDKDVIAAVDRLKEEGDITAEENVRIIIARADKKSKQNETRINEMKNQVSNLRKELDKTEKEKINAIQTGNKESRKNNELQAKLDKTQNTVQKQREKLSRYEEKERLSKEYIAIKESLDLMDKDKNNYIEKNDHFFFYYVIDVIILSVLLVSIIYLIYQYRKGGSLTIPIMMSALSVLVPIITPIRNKFIYIVDCQVTHDKIRKENEQLWISMHPDYTSLKSQANDIQNQIIEIERIIGDRIVDMLE